MPNTHETLTGLFSDIADAIRAKTGEAGAIIADRFPDAIAAISTGLEVSLDRIYADPLPDRLTYTVGEVFNPTGMVLKADFTIDGVSYPGAVVSNYSYPTAPLTQEDTVAVISTTVGGVTKTLDIDISVLIGAKIKVTVRSKSSYAGEYGYFDYSVGGTGAVPLEMQYQDAGTGNYIRVDDEHFFIVSNKELKFIGQSVTLAGTAWRLVFALGSRTVYLPFSPKVKGSVYSVDV